MSMRIVSRFSKPIPELIKQGWNEIPEILGGTAHALVGVVLAVIGLKKYYAKDGDNRQYKWTYCIVRRGDPMACRIKKPSITSYGC